MGRLDCRIHGQQIGLRRNVGEDAIRFEEQIRFTRHLLDLPGYAVHPLATGARCLLQSLHGRLYVSHSLRHRANVRHHLFDRGRRLTDTRRLAFDHFVEALDIAADLLHRRSGGLNALALLLDQPAHTLNAGVNLVDGGRRLFGVRGQGLPGLCQRGNRTLEVAHHSGKHLGEVVEPRGNLPNFVTGAHGESLREVALTVRHPL